MFQKCEGIVIRTIDYGESNKIVTIYTREWGKVGVMANGAKKPNSRLAAITQPFTYGYFLMQKSSGLGGLKQGEVILSLRGIREDIFKTAYASFVLELLDKAVENNQPNPYLFELLLQTLQYMNKGEDLEIITNIFEMKMLNVYGIYPKLDGCAVCQNTEGKFAFSIREGGFLCHRCLSKDPYALKISSATVKLLRLFYFLDMSRLGKISVKEDTKKELKKVISTFYDEYSGLNLKTKRFLNQIELLKDLKK
jgi:DNA repair protein RecO (recombination protein O)